MPPPGPGGGAPAADRPAKKARPTSEPRNGRLALSPRPSVRVPVQIITMGCIEARELVDRSRARNEAVPRPVPEVVTKLVKMARAKGRGRGRGPFIDPQRIEDCVRATGHAMSGDQVVVVDARGFSDPDQDHDRKHIGLDPVKIRDLVRHTEFRGTLEAMASNMRDAAQKVTHGGPAFARGLLPERRAPQCLLRPRCLGASQGVATCCGAPADLPRV